MLTKRYLWVMIAAMELLRKYLNGLSSKDQTAFVERCGTSLGYLRKAISADQKLSIELSVKIEQESGGIVKCEALRPDVDWKYLRTRKASTTSAEKSA